MFVSLAVRQIEGSNLSLGFFCVGERKAEAWGFLFKVVTNMIVKAGYGDVSTSWSHYGK
ncbi:hypothetical protein YDYSY3_46890 [Paenibacillus chitinolyticus]|nr:hypothetical protein YDYSY3_46890 [Paenibacillus chitinolyticus]